jgi:DNA processing protein
VVLTVASEFSTKEKELAVAVSLAKPAARYALTRHVVEAGSFADVAMHVSAAAMHEARAVLEQSADLGIAVVPVTCPEYPELLRHIDGPPTVLYLRAKAHTSAISAGSIAVVGRRAASVDTCVHATAIARELAQAGCTVVSGLALGIDAAAHRGALQTSLVCPTIAVLAHGLDRVYPPTHVGLAQQIVDAGGIILSEYAPGVQPMRHHFLARNRIIAGLSRGVVVVEAGARSGSLVTAQFAADYGRDVFVVEGSTDEESRAGGENLLAQGALSISGAGEVLAEYGLKGLGESGLEGGVTWQITTLEDLQQRGIGMAEILKLELSGKLEHLSGNRVRVCSKP